MERKYKPRRQSRRWLDSDCPPGVLAIYDNEKFADRYTVIYTETFGGDEYRNMRVGYRGMSAKPCDPQGVGMYGEFSAHDCAAYRYANRNRACRWSDLPLAVRRLAWEDCDAEGAPMEP